MSLYPNPHIQLSLNLKTLDEHARDDSDLGLANSPSPPAVPSLWGVPLKYISLITLAVQNSALTLIMHYSRVSTPPSRTYSAATAVLMNEILKCLISLIFAFARVEVPPAPTYNHDAVQSPALSRVWSRVRKLSSEVFSPDCWKLSIPAILYVIQNNLQYVAASNLEAATFQVTYQMKILTTAAFSVLLLRKKLSSSQWLSLLFLAIGVGVVQIQAGAASTLASHAAHADMSPLTGFMAVTAACFTSGLAGVYFEMVLKNSQGDLWVRNVQLSLFSLLPALAPVVFIQRNDIGNGEHLLAVLFRNFGAWAWATVAIQVFGGLVTALVIKYSDNILKGFATSLSIVISFLASVALFNFKMTFTFVLGSSIVLIASWLYNQQPKRIAYIKEPIGWGWIRNEKVKEMGTPPPVHTPLYGGLTAISSTSSLSSTLTGTNTPLLTDVEGKDSMRLNFVR